MSESTARVKVSLEATVDRIETEIRKDLLALPYLTASQVGEIEEILISNLIASPIAQNQINERQMSLFENNYGGSD